MLLCVCGHRMLPGSARRGGSEERANKEMRLVTNEYLTLNEYSRSSRAYLCKHLAPGHIHGVREWSRRRRAIHGRSIHRPSMGPHQQRRLHLQPSPSAAYERQAAME